MTDFNWGAGGSSALSGGASGAAVGTAILPGWGTAIGAGAGALGGLLMGGLSGGSSPYGNQYAGAPGLYAPMLNVPGMATPNQGAYQYDTSGINNSLAQLQQFANAPGVGVDQSASAATAAQQQQLIALLTGQANGTAGPSVAALQQKQGLDQAVQQGRSVAQSIAANNPIAALQASSGAQSLMQRQAINQAAQLRAQEQLNSQGLLGQTLSTARSANQNDAAQALQASTTNAGMRQNALNSILGANTNMAGQKLAANEGYDTARVAAQTDYNNNLMQSQANYQNAMTGYAANARNAYVQSRAQDIANSRQMLSTVLQGASAMGQGIANANRSSGFGSQSAVDAATQTAAQNYTGGLTNNWSTLVPQS